jgi:hypothetical protein
MKATTLEQLKLGKKIKVKHPEYGFTIHAELKLEEGKKEPSIKLEKINLPMKARKGEKLLLKLVNIYCFEVLCNNLLNDIVGSKEYKKALGLK